MNDLNDLIQTGQLHPTNSRSFLTSSKKKNGLVAKLGIEEVDNTLSEQGLPFGATHEWFLENELTSKEKYSWQVPLFLFAHFLRDSLSSLEKNSPLVFNQKRNIVWIGKRCWPTPHILAQANIFSEQDLFKRELFFLDPQSKDERLWTSVQALSCPSVLAVITDGSNFPFVGTRKLQLAAQKGNTLGLIARPPWESDSPSVSYTKWKLSTVSSSIASQEPLKRNSKKQQLTRTALHQQRWTLELLRSKGSSPPQSWCIEHQEEKAHEREESTLRLFREQRSEKRAAGSLS